MSILEEELKELLKRWDAEVRYCNEQRSRAIRRGNWAQADILETSAQDVQGCAEELESVLRSQ